MQEHVPLQLEPGWPRVRQLIAKKFRLSEKEVDRMADRGDSLEKVELVMMTEEVLDEIRRR
jgi:hypothetical protein